MKGVLSAKKRLLNRILALGGLRREILHGKFGDFLATKFNICDSFVKTM